MSETLLRMLPKRGILSFLLLLLAMSQSGTLPCFQFALFRYQEQFNDLRQKAIKSALDRNEDAFKVNQLKFCTIFMFFSAKSREKRKASE